MFHNHRYADPALDEIWRRVGEALDASAGDAVPVASTKLFVARPPGGGRACHNEDEVAAKFAANGFDIVRPETLGLAQQARLFRQADVVAGYGGSGTFSAMYGRPRAMIVITSESYYTTNEWLIAAVKGADYFHFWCDPDVPQPANAWTERAFQSGFAFDFERDGAELQAVLDKVRSY